MSAYLRLEAGREAIIEPVAVATCDLDPLIVHGAVPLEGPFPFGHEGVGRVVEVGDAVQTFVPGDLVSIPFQASGPRPSTTRRIAAITSARAVLTGIRG